MDTIKGVPVGLCFLFNPVSYLLYDSRWPVSFSCYNNYVFMYFFEKKYSKNLGCRLAGRHLLCSGVTRTSFSRFVACRSLFVASAWAVNDSLRSNMSPAFRRIARHALCGGVTQPFRPWRRITFAAVNHRESNRVRKALFESRISVPAFCCAKLLSFALCASKLSPAHLLAVLLPFCATKGQ